MGVVDSLGTACLRGNRDGSIAFTTYLAYLFSNLQSNDCVILIHKPRPAQIKNTGKPVFFIYGGSGWIRTNSGLSQQIYSLPRLSNSGARPILVRAEGIEPSFQAWKACILAFVLCPQQIVSTVIIYQFTTNASVYWLLSRIWICTWFAHIKQL